MRFRLALPPFMFALVAGCSDGPAEPEPDTGIELNVGQTFVAVGAGADSLKIRGAAGAEYTLIPFLGSDVNDASSTIDVTGQGITAAAGPPNPAASPAARFSLAAASRRVSSKSPAAEFHRRLRDYDRRLLASRRGAAMEPRANLSRSAAAAAVPNVGDVIRINAGSDIEADLCTVFRNRQGRVAAVSQRAIVAADITNPAGGFTDQQYRDFAAAFDTLVHPVNVQNFGEPGDIDQNQRSIIFFTRAVNELTPADVKYVIGGYFFSGDFEPVERCTATNRGEYFYMLVPDPTGQVNGNVRTAASVLESTVAILGHEFQHLINASRRLANGAPDEEVWLNEGLSHIAEELLFYRASGLAPRQNIGRSQFAAERAVNALFTYQIDNIARYAEYLENPEANSPYQRSDSLAVRGATWSFLRYAADQRNGTDSQLWKQLVESRVSGLANLQATLGSEAIPLIRDWAISVYADDAVAGVDAKYTQPSWNLRVLMPAFQSSGGTALWPTLPLKVRQMADATATNVALKGRGAAAFLRFGIGTSGEARITTTSAGGGALPPTASVAVVRTK